MNRSRCEYNQDYKIPWSANSIRLLTHRRIFVNVAKLAEVVKLVDTLASGASGGNSVEVRVLFSVPLYEFKTLRNGSQIHVIH